MLLLILFSQPTAAGFILLPVARSLALLAALAVFRKAQGDPREQATSFIASGLALWVVADITRILLWMLGEVRPLSPSLGDLLYVAGGLALAGGLAVYPSAYPQRLGRVRNLLDVVISVVAVLALSWLALVRPVLQLNLAEPALVGWIAARQLMDLISLTLAVRVTLLRSPVPGWTFGLYFAGAFALLSLTDVFYHYSLLMDVWQPGGWVELGWLLSTVLIVQASRRQLTDPNQEMESSRSRRHRYLSFRVERLLPVAYTYLLVGFALAEWWLEGRPDPLALSASILVLLLLIARQGVIAGQSEMRQHAALVNTAADLAFICNSEGQIVLANPAMSMATGVDPEEGEQPTLDQVLAKGNASDILNQGLEDGWSGEVEMRGREGEVFPAALSLRPVPDERSFEIILAGTAHDLTALKSREGDLRRALSEVAEARQELEVLNRSLEEKVEHRTEELAETIAHLEKLNEELKQLDKLKSEFVTLVSHELRGPLTNIRSGVELALSRSNQLSTRSEETLSLVAAETERLVSFVEIILDLSALEAGRFPLDLEPIPLAVLCRAVASRFPKDKRHRIRVEIPDELPPVYADEQALSSVLFHLFDNALKYAPTGPVMVEAEQKDSRVVVAVVDHGPGIPQKERQAVFERFHRLDSRDSREIYGHGLGLYLSRQLLHAMHGDIEIGEHESGARVKFWLPLKQGAPAEIPQG
ncbi:MAG: ATP-binding protein [Anaerolineales bacterium]